MSADDENGDEVDAGTWTKVASGDLGDIIYWETGFEALGEVQSILSRLEESAKKTLVGRVSLASAHISRGLRTPTSPLCTT
jgi:hypothetical protein